MRTNIKTKIRIKVSLLLPLLITFAGNSLAQKIPLVYSVENTGVDCTKPPLPDLTNLPVIEPLPDPFEWADGSGRSTDFKDWEHRRNEIGAEIEHYEIGTKPPRPDTITASYANDTLTVNVTRNGKTLTLTAKVVLPSGTGPFPAIIGVAFSGTGSLPDSIFTDRSIASIAFNQNQVTVYYNPQSTDPYYQLYPEMWNHSGQYSAWAWGVSRIIDGLELVQSDLPIDLKHLGVTGCSYAGKMALFAGAFDERIALTIAQESGGGGATSWRVSSTLGYVEDIGNTSRQWFSDDLFQFAGANVSKLPFDHHELMAMVAPRALYVTANPGFVWLANRSCYVCSRACQEIYDTLGIPDRFGFSIVGGHNHCAVPDVQIPEIIAFVDKFLLGDTTANTNITTNPYPFVNYRRWTNWWGSDTAVFPKRDASGTESVFLEPECGTVGSDWTIRAGGGASVGYVLASDTSSIDQAPTDSASDIYIPFTVHTDTTYYLYERSSCSNSNVDSYWMKMDSRNFVKYDGLAYSGGWLWNELDSFNLKAGQHTLTIAYCESNALLDKLCVSSFRYDPSDLGDTAANICEPVYTRPPSVGINEVKTTTNYVLGQNYPNPASGNTTITFAIPHDTYVSLKIYSLLGQEIKELAGKEYIAGKHSVSFDTRDLSKGIYFYKMETDKFSETRRMFIQAK